MQICSTLTQPQERRQPVIVLTVECKINSNHWGGQGKQAAANEACTVGEELVLAPRTVAALVRPFVHTRM